MSDKERLFGPPGISALQHQSPPSPLQPKERHITIEVEPFARLVFVQLVELILQQDVVWLFEIWIELG